MADEFEQLQDVEPVTFNAEDYEEITSEEVDRVVAVLDELMHTVTSENIRAHLSAAADSIFALIYDESGELVETGEASEEPAHEAA
jgi:hypothetical protein